MKQLTILFALCSMLAGCISENNASRKTIQLEDQWKFINMDVESGHIPDIPLDNWQNITVPHDWAISGKFDRSIDEQVIMVKEDGENVPKLRTGRTGALPHIGVGWYRRVVEIPESYREKRIFLEFDGAMSHSKVFINGNFAGEWPYGYASFGFDVTEHINFGEKNTVAVRLENKPLSSRWYPGAGIYRNVRLVITNPVHIKQWGTFITTPEIQKGIGAVDLNISIASHHQNSENLRIETVIHNQLGITVAKSVQNLIISSDTTLHQKLTVDTPVLWSVQNPVTYTAVTKIKKKNKELDHFETPFGFRYFEFTSDSGFYLNGKRTELNGVCLHHDLGPLGAAVNLSALRYRLKLLKDMGCNAIRTTHNPPAPELLSLTDEMGFLVINEAFDEWKYGKMDNGYNTLWDEWAEKDLVAFIHRDRNHPSVIAWSIGNELREQDREDGAEYCRFLVDICHREDPTRPTTAGFSRWKEAIENGLVEVVDVVGWNYKPQYYGQIHNLYPHWKMYGSETSSTVSSRGEYFLPAIERVHYTREPYHGSSFDMEFPLWATSADREFAAQDSFSFMAGEFVWTGFDYLGEPTPFNVEWPARSSYFGIIDLCGIPKDRYYLYQSKWTDQEVLHILPHWNWEEGQVIPVHCYTNFNKAELFLNGKSQGIRQKTTENVYTRYRLIWEEVVYEAGEIKVVALDEQNQPLKEARVQTAGKPAKITLLPDRTRIVADGKDLSFITVSIVDENGILCPRADNLINFSLEGKCRLIAVGNGDPTSLESFVKPYRHAFNGKCMAIVQSSIDESTIILKAESEGLEQALVTITTSR
jgi:beta-galactosidase